MTESGLSEFNTLGAYLEAWGKATQLKGYEIAAVIGVTPAIYSNWKASINVPGTEYDDDLIALAGVFASTAGEEVTPIQDEILGLTQNDRLKSRKQLTADRNRVKGGAKTGKGYKKALEHSL